MEKGRNEEGGGRAAGLSGSIVNSGGQLSGGGVGYRGVRPGLCEPVGDGSPPFPADIWLLRQVLLICI